MIGPSLWLLNSMRQEKHTQHFNSANHSNWALAMAKSFKHLRVTLPEVWELQGIPSVWAGYAISDFGRHLWAYSFKTQIKLSLPQYSFLLAPLRRYTGLLSTGCSRRLQISMVILFVSRFPCSVWSLLKIKSAWALEYVVRGTAFLFSEVNLILEFTLANPDFAVLCFRELHTSHFIFISAEHHNVLCLTVLCQLQYINTSMIFKLFV